MPSFDVVSRVDLQEVDNAINQVKKELESRYDFKNSKATVEFDKKEKIELLADDSMKLQAMVQILKEKLAKRNVGVRALEFKDPEQATGSMLRQVVLIKQGISTDDGRKIVKTIKEQNMKKVQAQIQQDQVRVTGPKRDDLQKVIALLKSSVQLELQFVNFKE